VTTASSSSPPTDQPQFVHRVVRILAVVLLGYAAQYVVQYIVGLFVEGSWWSYMRGGLRLVERAIQLSLFGNLLLLGVGAAGLLGWKRWARPAVMLWAVLTIVLQFATHALWVVDYFRQLSTVPATQAALNSPVWKYMLMSAFSWLGSVFFPLLVWLILRQPEVASLFTRPRSGGFEVVPFAQPVGDGTASPRGVTN
jgi:hypothetical protein